MMTRLLFNGLFSILALISIVYAADNFNFYERGPYRANVPKPSSILGYEPGQFHTSYGNMERVIEKIAAAAPDRVRLFQYGKSYEYRTLHLVVISSPENLSQLEQIKANAAKLADPRKLSSNAEAEQIIKETPIIAWLNYANDGNESAAFEAAMQVAYQLAASEESKTAEVLRNVVTIINPAHNPESHERFVTWYNAFGVGNPEPLAREHRAPMWLSTNNNHYQIDMNRDALGITQQETVAITRAILEWRPQVFVDHHGQTPQFFFPPAASPINANLPVENTKKWLDIFGRGNAAAFDRYGWNYFVRDVFDLYYPGYFDSWPALNGAIGMTYETDGGGDKGYAWRRDDDALVTLRDGIAKHFVASMATIETAGANREARLRDYHQFFKTAMEEGRTGKMKRFVLLPGKDRVRAAELVTTLLRAGIEVKTANAPFKSTAAHDYFGNKATDREFPAGSYIIDLAQPQMRLAKTLLEPTAELDPEFVKQELAKMERNLKRAKKAAKEREAFYDVTAWSLPLTFGVEAYWTEDATEVSAAAVVALEIDYRKGASGSARHIHLAPAPGIKPEGRIIGGRANTAYVFSYESNGAARLALQLMKEDFKVAVATRPLRAGGRDFPRGSLVVRVVYNKENLHERIEHLAKDAGIDVFAINSAYTDTGDTGVGSGAVVTLTRPNVIILTDDVGRPESYGAMWFMFEQIYGYDFTPLSVDGLKSIDLRKYNVIILPDVIPQTLASRLGKDGIEKLKSWVQQGGVLVGIGGGAVFATLKDVDLTTSRLVGEESEQPASAQRASEKEGQPATEAKPAQESQPPQRGARQQAQRVEPPHPTAAEKPKQTQPLDVPGSIFRATVDTTHFLSYGYEEPTLPVLVNSGNFFKPSKEGSNVVRFEGAKLLISGFEWPDNTEPLLSGASYVIDEPVGRGHVILYANDVNWRLVWRSTSRLFLNSVIFAPTLR